MFKLLTVQEIRELIKLVDETNIDEFVYEHDGTKIKMIKHGADTVTTVQPVLQATEAAPVAIPKVEIPAAAPAALQQEIVKEESKAEQNRAAVASDLHKIVSPMVGTFYSSPSPDADDYVKIGSKVSKDSIVCIVEAMKLFNEIEAEVNGEIVEMLVKNGQLVEYGQLLFLVKPE